MTYRISKCPFCGHAPVAFASGEGERGMMIECETPGCVNPHVSYYDRHTAVRVWNQRVEGECNLIVTDAQVNGTSPL